MEITSATTPAKANYVKGRDDEEEEQQAQETTAEENAVAETEPDKVTLTRDDNYDTANVEEKVNNYIQNFLANPKLTDAARAALKTYLNDFDAAAFIKAYGPFESARDISAAMYAVTAGLVKYQDE
ncbi:MAG: hypothetical protein KH301_06380 [Brachyspira sp.]|uniref:hypothetical protein n=1 Tax=Candidatus Scatousia sp. TaxID=3085663 RepID=UPI004025D315|nr:hypothetical protein [Brachyspira sp.]